MKKKKKFSLKSKYILTVITVFCLVMIFLSFVTDISAGPLKTFTGYIIMPIQNGINNVGEWLSQKGDYFRNLDELIEKNQELQDQLDDLTAQNAQLIQDTYNLQRYEELLELKETYKDYDMVAASVISKNPDNWFSTFVIDKGSEDGIQVDSNVLTPNGLVGIVTDVGPQWASVRSIIDDVSNVSAMVQSTSHDCTIAGDLRLMDQGRIHILKLNDEEGEVQQGDAIVTSNISSKYHGGILIGYVSNLTLDANNLTRSGHITPAVDFSHLHEVLVIKDVKQAVGD